MSIVTFALADAAAEERYDGFRDALCDGHARRYAMLYKGADGVRCQLQNSGRCLDPDTPWHMVRFLVEPLFRFDDATEWVVLLPVETWKQRCDEALQQSMADEQGRPWSIILAEALAGEMAGRPHLKITR